MRFRTLLFGICAAAVTLPCLVLAVMQYRSTTADIRETEAQNRKVSALVSDRLEQRMQTAAGVLELTAHFVRLQGVENHTELNDYLERIREKFPDCLNIHVDDADGKSIAFAPATNMRGQSNIGQDHRARPHWKNKPKKPELLISGVVQAQGAAEGKIVNLTYPVFENGRLRALAVAALDLQALSDRILKDLPRHSYDIGIFDGSDNPVFGSTLDLPKLQDFKAKTSDYIGVLEPLGTGGWQIGVFTKKVNREIIFRDLVVKNIVVWLFVVVVALAVGMLASIDLARAVEKLSMQMKAARSSPKSDEVIRSPQELVQLQQTYGSMQKKLEETGEKLVRLNASLEEEVRVQVQKIRRHEATLSAVFEGMEEGFILLDAGYLVVSVNQAARRLLTDETGQRRLIDSLRQAEDKTSFKLAVGKKTLECRSFEIDDASCPMTGILIRDITSKEELDRMKDELIGVVAHELKTPLAAIRLQAECLAKESDNELSKETARGLLEEADDMKALITGWLDAARLQDGSYPLMPELCSIKSLVSKAVRLAIRNRANMDVDIEENAKVGFVDRDAFVRILVNLLSNAVKYKADDRMLVVAVKARRESNVLTLTVQDNGQGIAPENLEKVFDRFFQAKMDSTRKTGGVGLGLVITKELVELHGGTIEVTSCLGRGTTFVMRFPFPEPQTFRTQTC